MVLQIGFLSLKLFLVRPSWNQASQIWPIITIKRQFFILQPKNSETDSNHTGYASAFGHNTAEGRRSTFRMNFFLKKHTFFYTYVFTRYK